MIVKDLNTQRVKVALKSARSATVRDLSRVSDLSPVTVSSILQTLLSEGFAVGAASVPSQGGRPSRLFRYNENRLHTLIVFSQELNGRDHLSVRVTDLYGKILFSEDHPFGFASLEAFDPFLDAVIGRFPHVGALGFGLPGVEQAGRLVALDYQALVGKDLVEHFRNRYGRPVIVENDVNAAVIGHGLREGLTDTEVYLYVPQKYRPGAGIRIGQQLLKGRHGFAGEVGWLLTGNDFAELTSAADESVLCGAITQIVVALVSTIDPDTVVLTGSLLTPRHLTVIREKCRTALPSWVTPQIDLAESLREDIQAGVTALVLKSLEPEQPLCSWK
jgi:ROK family